MQTREVYPLWFPFAGFYLIFLKLKSIIEYGKIIK